MDYFLHQFIQKLWIESLLKEELQSVNKLKGKFNKNSGNITTTDNYILKKLSSKN